MSLADRLRSVIRAGGSAEPTGRAAEPALRTKEVVRGPGAAGRFVGSADPASDPADLLAGEWRDWNGYRYLIVDHRYPSGHRHGRMAIADASPGDEGAWPALSILEPAAGGRLLFMDLETTGLAGGAGTYAFLVGCAWFEGGGLRVRQFLLADYGSERGLLEQVAGTARECGTVSTYNGKTFDLPLMETRALFHRIEHPFAGMPHLDMLHPARRLWSVRRAGSAEDAIHRSADPPISCGLTTLERTLLGYMRQDDVPGFEIPSRYFHYVRSGDARPLAGVLEHNRLDLLSLAMLTATAARLLGEGAAGARTAREALGLGRIYERAGRVEDALPCYERVAALAADSETTAEALRASAVLARRSRRYEDAARAWARILELPSCPPRAVQEASEALAVHHEHRLRELDAARRFAMRSLDLTTSAARLQAARHRLARLERKLECADSTVIKGGGPELAPLFEVTRVDQLRYPHAPSPPGRLKPAPTSKKGS